MSFFPRSRLLRAACVSFASLAIALGGAELYLRLFAPVKFRAPLDSDQDAEWRTLVHRRSKVPGLAYELAPSVEKEVRGMRVVTNELGLRGRMPEIPKGHELLRIAAVGDSVTFGFSVAAEESWPVALERELTARRESRRYEVLNFGVGGYSTRDEALVVEHKVLPLEPDLVIVGYFLNDPDFEPQQQPLHRFFRGSAWWEHLHVARLVARWRFDRERAAAGNDLYRWSHAPESDRWRSVLDGFDAMQRATRVPILLVAFPSYRGFESFDRYGYADLHERVLAEGRNRGFATLDLVPAFAASGRSPWDVSADAEHPNAEGHAIAARAIAEFVRARHRELLGTDP